MDDGFRRQLTSLLSSVPFEAVRFEMPYITSANMDTRGFEFVIVDAPDLARRLPNTRTFHEHFERENSNVAAFPNINGDALLVAPKPDGDKDFSQLMGFLRTASQDQTSEFWKKVFKIQL